MDLTKRIKKVALANHMDYVGVAPVERLEDEPEGLKPESFLPGAQSVISLGINMNLGTQLAHQIAYNHHQRNAILGYMWWSFNALNFHLDRAAYYVSRLVEDEDPGYLAVPMPSSSPFSLRRSITEFSNVHAAVAAGLGKLGWNGFCLNPGRGPAVRYTSIITNVSLAPTPMYSGPRLCEPEECGFVCAKVCPTDALLPEKERRIIGGIGVDVAGLDRWRCLWGRLGLSQGSLALSPIPIPDNIDLEVINKALTQRDPRQSTEVGPFGTVDYCGKCIVQCPVGGERQIIMGKH
ncbi:hypothetical protein ACFLU4_00295 [Chloroflexota bacterium]